MQPECWTWKINSVSTKTNEYVHSSFTHISPTLVFSRDQEENLITSLSLSSIGYSLHSSVFNKHSTSIALINNYIKSEESSFTDILKYKGHSKSKVNSKVCVLILKYLDLIIFLIRRKRQRLFLLPNLYFLSPNLKKRSFRR